MRFTNKPLELYTSFFDLKHFNLDKKRIYKDSYKQITYIGQKKIKQKNIERTKHMDFL